MCGIAGIFSPRQSNLSLTEMRGAVELMNAEMIHRGPDSGGIWSDPNGRCVLGHRRLSIIDTSDAGLQPMVSRDGAHVITFNGEIYNYTDLRPKLELLKGRFRGQSDTEVLVEGLSEWGVDSLALFDGMFAFAMFNARSGDLLIARDAFGEKPLYYTFLRSGAVAFASELQALERCPGFDARVDISAMAEVLSFQYIGAPRTIYSGVQQLCPGHWMRVNEYGETKTVRYFSYNPGATGFTRRKLPDLADELEDILSRSISRRMISDVPLGAFLSGGVDSSTICALICKKLKRPLKTFSFGFLDAPESEHLVARIFAETLGTEHYDQVLTPDVSEFLRDIGSKLDQPNGDSSCLPTYLLSKFARQQVTVAISGDGGDEMFGGYGRYFATLDELSKRRNGEIGDWWTPGGAYYGNRILVSVEHQIQELFGFVPRAYADHVARLRHAVDAKSENLLCELRRTDVENYMPGAVLPKVDRMSMRCSLEVRTPFLNAEVARFAERLPESTLVDGARGKLVLREIAYRYLPRDLVDLPKKGFGLPMSDWARGSMLDAASALLESDDSRLRFCFGPAGIARFLGRQRTEGQFSPYQVWGVTMLESWLRRHPAELPRMGETQVHSRHPRETSPDSRTQVRQGEDRATLWTPDSISVEKLLKAPLTVDERERHEQSSLTPLMSETPLLDRAGGTSGDAESYQLAIARIHGPIFSVTRTKRTRPLPLDDCDKVDPLNLIPGELVISILKLLEGVPPAERNCPKGSWYIPDFGAPLDQDTSVPPGALSEATLVFTDTDAGRFLNYNELFRFRRLGVRRLLMLNAYDHGTIVELSFNGHRGIKRVLATIRALIQSKAVISNSFAHRLIGGKNYIAVDGLLRSEEIRAIDPIPDVDLSDRFFAFEGMRQLPPLETTHALIKEIGGGRYSVWNQRLFVKATERSRANKTYRIVPIDEKTNTLAPIARRSRSLRKFDFESGRELIERLVQSNARDNEPLRPGDSLVVCTHGLPPGGAERQWVYLAQSLKDLGYNVTFVVYDTLDSDNHYLSLLRASAVPLIDGSTFTRREQLNRWPEDSPLDLAQLSSLPSPVQILSLVAAFQTTRPKAVLLQLDMPNIIGAIAAYISRVSRIVLSFRNYNPTHFPYLRNDWFQPMYKILSNTSNVLLSGNHREANDDYARWIGVSAKSIAYIPNAIDPAVFELPDAERLEEARRELDIAPSTPIILGVFRQSPEKDPLSFVNVCNIVMSSVPDAVAIVVGVGPMREKIEAQVQKLGLSTKVRLLGKRADVNVLMRLASVFLLTSRKEGMPNVLMEALLMATAVVASDTGGVRDILGPLGSVRAVGDVPGLAADCIKYLRDASLANRVGTEGRMRMLELFPKHVLGERYLQLVRLSFMETAQVAPPLSIVA